MNNHGLALWVSVLLIVSALIWFTFLAASKSFTFVELIITVLSFIAVMMGSAWLGSVGTGDVGPVNQNPPEVQDATKDQSYFSN